MKVFISCDIEGTALTTLWDECYPKTMSTSELAGVQHTNEVKAACFGALEAGATEIVVRDAHNSGTHLNVAELPKEVKVIRGWCGDPMGMTYGLDESFDAALFVGYHSAAGRMGNPLCHTETRDPLWIRLNGKICSEFLFYSLAAATKGVPSVFLSGDKMLCEDSLALNLHSALKTVAVKEGFGGATMCVHPLKACEMIRNGVREALSQKFSGTAPKLPEHFTYEICFKEMTQAVEKSFYPGFELVNDTTIRMETDNYMDILRSINFVL